MQDVISIRGAKEHNLKNVSVDIPRNQLVVITGLSGSGKSSLAFDTLYAEGQRRYVESLSAYARQFLQMQNKPDVESISGLSPAIAIDQKTTSRNPRSTVGTITEIYDYLRLLYARIGIPYSPATGLPIQKQTVTQMVDAIVELPAGTKLMILAPIVRGAKGEYRKEFQQLRKQGFQRVKIDDELIELDSIPTLDKNKKHTIEVVIDRIVVSDTLGNRLADSIETALQLADGLMAIEIVDWPEGVEPAKQEGNVQKLIHVHKGGQKLFSEHFACPVSGFQLGEIEPRLFSFNSPFGACPACEGLGIEYFFDPELVVPDPNKSLLEGAIAPWAEQPSKYVQQLLESLARHYQFNLTTPFKELPETVKQVLYYGSGDEEITLQFSDGMRRQETSKLFEGVIGYLQKRLRDSDANWIHEELGKYQSRRPCQSCSGFRLKAEALCVKVVGKHIGEISDMTIAHTKEWFASLYEQLSSTHQQIAERVLKEIQERLNFLNNVGLDYLTLSRESGTISGGETQRIRLASQIGSGLSGVLYVLDEPSIGLHQCDNDRLIETLKHLRDLGNTVIVVEHDEETMQAADYLIDIGPGAGVHGGEVVAYGTPTEVSAHTNSITADYLSGRKMVEVPKERRPGHSGKTLKLTNARSNNLQNVSIAVPLGTFTAVTGVSGGGKSTLIMHTLYKAAIKRLEGTKAIPGLYDDLLGLEYIDKIIQIDQSPIGRTPRSNPATYTGAFTPIRDWFVELPESKARGYKVGRFSFNVKGGRCEVCQGDGLIKIEMHFLPDVYVTCDECRGQRYNRETLEVKYKGKSIADVLCMTVEDAVVFFDKMPHIHDKMQALMEVGLGYIRIGQSATTLSGGEAQRVKLAKELSRRSTGRTLYILDEPTTGLHFDDINKLLKVLHKLVDMGNTVLVIEHNMDVIKTADHVIDIGPGGGDKGGRVLASGTPEELLMCKESITGKYLKKHLPVA
jgi:excinuclease ABC subunit A